MSVILGHFGGSCPASLPEQESVDKIILLPKTIAASPELFGQRYTGHAPGGALSCILFRPKD